MKQIPCWFFLLITSLQLYAHVGSPGVIMQAGAGPYKVLLTVQPPDVIPGIATVTVIPTEGNVQSVFARPLYYRFGDKGAPSYDELKMQDKQFAGMVWLMAIGSSGIQIIVKGDQGEGAVVVPVVAVSTAQKQMPASTGWGLTAMGLFLAVLFATIFAVAVSTAQVGEDEPMSPGRNRARITGFVVGGFLIAAIAYGGSAWWKSWASGYRQYMFQPLKSFPSVVEEGNIQYLKLNLDTTNVRRNSFSYIIPDHGKMMHMFIIRVPQMDAFAHLHPQRKDSASYQTILPPLPKGKYLLFADIVYTSGFAETIKDTFLISNIAPDTTRLLDTDDGFAFAQPADTRGDMPYFVKKDVIVCGKPGAGVRLKDSSTMAWEEDSDEPYKAGTLYNLQFAVASPDGSPAKLDPYLGMMGHAAVMRTDGNVYVHLHPVGSYSLAAGQNFDRRIHDTITTIVYPPRKPFRDSVDRYIDSLNSLDEKSRQAILMKGMHMTGEDKTNGDHHSTVAFPYIFPTSGNYRIWVQVKKNGQVLTGVFDKVVR